MFHNIKVILLSVFYPEQYQTYLMTDHPNKYFEDDLDKYSKIDAVILTWAAVIVGRLFDIGMLAILITFLVKSGVVGSDALGDLFSKNSYMSVFMGFMTYSVLVLIYPITTYLVTELWQVYFRFLCVWVEREEEAHQISSEIGINLIGTNAFLALPIVGQFASSISHFFVLYTSLKVRLGFSSTGALLLCMAPKFMLATVLGLIFLSLFHFLSLFFI